MAAKLLFLNKLDDAALTNVYSSDFFLNQVQSPSYSRLSQQYYAEYYNSENWTNLSVALENEGKIVAMVIIYYDGNRQASFFHQPALIALPDSPSQALQLDIDNMFDMLFSKIKALNIEDVLLSTSKCIETYLRDVKITESSIAYVDLDLSMVEIKRNVRKSYKSLINWGLKNIDISIIDQDNQDYNAFHEFMYFHHKVSGKVTRSDESWDIQYQMVCEGEAFVLLGYMQTMLVSASLVVHSKSEAYYGVGVYDRELMSRGVALAHGLLFKAIEIAKNMNLKNFILGDVSTFNTPKDESIAKFKLGFTKSTFQNKSVFASVFD